jgi:hypothetical protein
LYGESGVSFVNVLYELKLPFVLAIRSNHSVLMLQGQEEAFSSHQHWDQGKGWKSRLNNLRLVLQPYVYFNLLRPWLTVFSIPSLSNSFSKLLKSQPPAKPEA